MTGAGKVFTYSLDHLAGTTDTPLVIAVIDFDGGRPRAVHDD